MAQKSLVSEAQDTQLAIELVGMGARLQVLEAETSLSRERLIKLYKEVRGESPPKGLLPFSTDWFTTWLPNIHGSLFANIHRYVSEHAGLSGIHATMQAYRLYREHQQDEGGEPVLGLTRAWTLVRFMDSGMLSLVPCNRCGGHFLSHTYDLNQDFVCGMCHMPSRAGKTRRNRAVDAEDAVA
ncbi:MAG: flagellar transcriptional regulator FlhC [Pseudomonadota bacterium]|nr:flagellar transcriptional regulator FlhC [Pseudomonadota bacterium]